MVKAKQNEDKGVEEKRLRSGKKRETLEKKRTTRKSSQNSKESRESRDTKDAKESKVLKEANSNTGKSGKNVKPKTRGRKKKTEIEVETIDHEESTDSDILDESFENNLEVSKNIIKDVEKGVSKKGRKNVNQSKDKNDDSLNATAGSGEEGKKRKGRKSKNATIVSPKPSQKSETSTVEDNIQDKDASNFQDGTVSKRRKSKVSGNVRRKKRSVQSTLTQLSSSRSDDIKSPERDSEFESHIIDQSKSTPSKDFHTPSKRRSSPEKQRNRTPSTQQTTSSSMQSEKPVEKDPNESYDDSSNIESSGRKRLQSPISKTHATLNKNSISSMRSLRKSVSSILQNDGVRETSDAMEDISNVHIIPPSQNLDEENMEDIMEELTASESHYYEPSDQSEEINELSEGGQCVQRRVRYIKSLYPTLSEPQIVHVLHLHSCRVDHSISYLKNILGKSTSISIVPSFHSEQDKILRKLYENIDSEDYRILRDYLMKLRKVLVVDFNRKKNSEKLITTLSDRIDYLFHHSTTNLKLKLFIMKELSVS